MKNEDRLICLELAQGKHSCLSELVFLSSSKAPVIEVEQGDNVIYLNIHRLEEFEKSLRMLRIQWKKAHV